jgi:vanadium chloroperoxidase
MGMQDSILFWNAIALEANRVSHSEPGKREQNGPTLSSRALAIVHLAMYDAYAAIIGGGFPRYLSAPIPPAPLPAPANVRDAVAGAAFTTLSALYLEQQDYFREQLACFNVGPTSYFAFGVQVGEAMVALRREDMDGRSCGYMASRDRGRHRVDPDNPGQGFDSPYYGAQTRTFAVTTRHGLSSPPQVNNATTSAKYLAALKDVRTRGIRPDLTGTLPETLFKRRRTSSETLIGIYWAYDGAIRLGTPPRFYNRIIRQVAHQRGNSEGQNARLFAFVNAAMGDAGILAWQQKYCWDTWRPVLGIREHDSSLGPDAPHAGTTTFEDGDPSWLPLGAPSTNATTAKNFTPNFPAYPSGHATFGAAAFHIARMFYGIGANDKSNDTLVTEFVVSEEFNGGNRDNVGTVRPRHTRRFRGGLWEMIIENALSRVYLGVHWIFDAFDFREGVGGVLIPDLANEQIGGVGLGLRIARDIFSAGGGLAPTMSPAGLLPPIVTPAPGSPLPQRPAQPAMVGGCAGTQASQPGAAAAGEATTGTSSIVQSPWPSGLSER